ncbi:hypothetical protein [Agrobacterium tumefaciens]|uniref:hypothetical protein n=1 Tax=Agrobacterium tumefaciens TaxID=358 RepID=UPI00045B20E6|nr:hypothetical protein [Agrobacterium tumefaciens]CDN96059.1 hypothetical protein BN949_05233 [Agrobacterium tumefaciens]
MQSHLNDNPNEEKPAVTADNFPKIDTSGSLADILVEVVARLDQVSEVLSREYLWLKPKMAEARADQAEHVAAGLVDPDLNDGSDVEITFDNAELDKHLLNVQMASLIANDAATAIKSGFVTEGDE